jgi:hypothetical protein
MNHYSHSGQPHGLKSIAQELTRYGRNGDTILAHINPTEAALLKKLGGSGTINPVTGLPEYFFKAVSRAVAAPFRAVNQVVKAIPVIGPAIDKGLVSLDKAVGSAIPGGWNTLAQTALAFTPLGLPAKVGLAALGGSGAFGPSGKFNFQKALLSGAMAYGMNQLAQGLQEAGSASYDPSAGLTDATTKAASNIDPGILEGMTAEQVANAAQASPYFQAAQQNIDPGFLESMSAADVAKANVLPSTPNAAPAGFFQQTGQNLAAAGQGIKNLTGFGVGTAGEAATKFVAPVTAAGMASLGVGTMGLMQLNEQEKLLNEQLASGSIAQSEYDANMARINEARARAEQAVRDNPYQFAVGGSVDDEPGMDSVRGMDQGNLQRGLFGMGYAVGGQPRFLSGGGDGMSDSIQATINDKQPARLADGEFVVPADVVSNLGNGSSKAGAKRLYGMMDRVRKARTGTTKQAKAINPAKVMPA